MIYCSVYCEECDVCLADACTLKEADTIAATHLEEEHDD